MAQCALHPAQASRDGSFPLPKSPIPFFWAKNLSAPSSAAEQPLTMLSVALSQGLRLRYFLWRSCKETIQDFEAQRPIWGLQNMEGAVCPRMVINTPAPSHHLGPATFIYVLLLKAKDV